MSKRKSKPTAKPAGKRSRAAKISSSRSSKSAASPAPSRAASVADAERALALAVKVAKKAPTAANLKRVRQLSALAERASERESAATWEKAAKRYRKKGKDGKRRRVKEFDPKSFRRGKPTAVMLAAIDGALRAVKTAIARATGVKWSLAIKTPARIWIRRGDFTPAPRSRVSYNGIVAAYAAIAHSPAVATLARYHAAFKVATRDAGERKPRVYTAAYSGVFVGSLQTAQVTAIDWAKRYATAGDSPTTAAAPGDSVVKAFHLFVGRPV